MCRRCSGPSRGLWSYPACNRAPEAVLDTPPQRSLADRIIHATIVVGIANVLVKLSGLIQTRLATRVLETPEYEAIFTVAFTGVVIALFSIGNEIIQPSFLPVFMKERERGGEPAAWDFANVVFTLQTLIVLLLCLALACFPDVVLKLLTEWTPADNPEHYPLARRSLQWLAPGLLFLSLGSTTYIILNGYRKFFLAAFGDAAWKFCVVALLVGMSLFGWDYRALFFGLLAGSAAKVLTHLTGLLRQLRYVRPNFRFRRNPALKAMLFMLLPLLAGILFAKYRDAFNNVYILTHLKGISGLLQANDIGRRIFGGVSLVFPMTLQIALFPFFCELVAKNNHADLGQVITRATRLLLSVFLPGAVLLALLAEPLTVLAFYEDGGKLKFGVALWAGLATACYMLALPANAVECVLMQGYHATRKMVTVTIIGVVASLLSIAVSYVVVIRLGVGPLGAIVGVALGFALSRWLKSLALVAILKWSVPMFPWRETMWFLARLLLVAAAAGLATWATQRGLDRVLTDGLAAAKAELARAAPGTMAVQASVGHRLLAVRLVLAGLAGGLALLGGAWLLHVREPFEMIAWTVAKLRDRLKGRGSSGPAAAAPGAGQ